MKDEACFQRIRKLGLGEPFPALSWPQPERSLRMNQVAVLELTQKGKGCFPALGQISHSSATERKELLKGYAARPVFRGFCHLCPQSVTSHSGFVDGQQEVQKARLNPWCSFLLGCAQLLGILVFSGWIRRKLESRWNLWPSAVIPRCPPACAHVADLV